MVQNRRKGVRLMVAPWQVGKDELNILRYRNANNTDNGQYNCGGHALNTKTWYHPYNKEVENIWNTIDSYIARGFDEEEITEGDTRVVLHLHPALAPYKVAVLPLSKKLSETAQEVYEQFIENHDLDSWWKICGQTVLGQHPEC